MSLDTKFLLGEIDKLFAKQNAKWDQWFAARDAKWDQRFSSRKGTLPIQISTEQSAPAPSTTTSPPTAFPNAAAAAASFVAPPEGADVEREVPLASRVVPTTAGVAEILDIESTGEIRNGFADIAPTGEIRSDGFLTPWVIAPTETAAILPVDAGQELVKCGPVDNRSIPASAFLVSSAASYDTPVPVPSTADLAADCIHCGLITSELVTMPTGMLFQSVSSGLYIDIAPSNAADYMSNRCSMFCCSDFSSMVTTTLSSSTTTWMFAEVIYNFGKRLWPPPPLAPVLSEQGMHKLVVVGPLIDAKLNVIWSKSPWPPPTEWLLHCAIVQLRPIPWPSFDSWNAQCASGQHSEKDMDFVLWILEKSAWPFAKLVCWSSDVCAAMTEITRAHMQVFVCSLLCSGRYHDQYIFGAVLVDSFCGK